MAKRNLPLEERFMQYVSPEPNSGCWLWTGFCHPRGYGMFRSRFGKNEQAHRMAFMLFIGPIPDGSLCCHACDGRSCVNPDHLFLGDEQANASDMVSKGRYPKSQKLRLPTGVFKVSGRKHAAYGARVCYQMRMLHFGVYETPERAGEVAAYHRSRLHGLRSPARP